MDLDPNTIKLIVAIVGFILGVAGLALFLVKILFGRVYAAIKTLFETKEKFEERLLDHERKIARLEKTILSMDPEQTVLLRNIK